jgi:hypothetical protein
MEKLNIKCPVKKMNFNTIPSKLLKPKPPKGIWRLFLNITASSAQ